LFQAESEEEKQKWLKNLEEFAGMSFLEEKKKFSLTLTDFFLKKK